MHHCDQPYDLYMLRGHPDKWGNTGAVRRARRQINRAWAKSGRRDYGIKSVVSYCAYIKMHGYLVGDRHV